MKSIKNKTASTIYLLGAEFAPNTWVVIPQNLELKYAMSEDVINKIMSGDIVVSADNATELPKSQAIAFLNGYITDSEGYPISKSVPFSSKTIGGKKLFKRVHGIQKECVVGENVFEFIIPYPSCKITGMEMIGGTSCDKVNLEVYDTATGAISGVPNYKLNQFGFLVNVSENYYAHTSEYDADMYLGMKLEVHYFSQVAKTIGVNFILNELK